jgi:predicted transposase YdaD
LIDRDLVSREKAGVQDCCALAAQDILQGTPTAAEFRRRLDLVEAILVNKFPQLSPEEILKMLDLRTADVTQTRFYQEVFQVGQQEERQQEGKTDLVLLLLNRRCGLLSLAQEKQVRGLEIEQLETLGDALLDFTGMIDLTGWLSGQ